MKFKNIWTSIVIIIILVASIIIGLQLIQKPDPIEIKYPFEGTLYPKDIAPPSFVWENNNSKVKSWQVSLLLGEEYIIDKIELNQPYWKPGLKKW